MMLFHLINYQYNQLARINVFLSFADAPGVFDFFRRPPFCQHCMHVLPFPFCFLTFRELIICLSFAVPSMSLNDYCCSIVCVDILSALYAWFAFPFLSLFCVALCPEWRLFLSVLLSLSEAMFALICRNHCFASKYLLVLVCHAVVIVPLCRPCVPSHFRSMLNLFVLSPCSNIFVCIFLFLSLMFVSFE